MRVLLCRPPFVGLHFGPPIGLLYLISGLKNKGHEVKLLDINKDLFNTFPYYHYNRDFEVPNDHPSVSYANDRLDQYAGNILGFNPDVVGFSLSYGTYAYGIELARRVCTHVSCIAGGPQCTYIEHDIVELGLFKAVVSGYGEESIEEALTGAGIIKRPLKKDKEYLPDFEAMELSAYNGILPIVTTRGCPNHCLFCTQHLPYYYHDIDSILRTLSHFKQAGLREVMYNDSNINVNPKRTTELFKAIAAFGIGVPAHVFGMQVKEGFEDYIYLMKASGVNVVRLGIESGSPRERKSMNKPKFDNRLAVKMVAELSKNQITTWAQFIFCYPDQTDEDRQQTLELMRQMNEAGDPSYIKHFWFQFVVHHGTEELFRKLYNVNKITPKTWTNELYDRQIIRNIYQQYKEIVPQNCTIEVDEIEAWEVKSIKKY
jgi:radical SAM superfamily enzyme YgiQ (UPF0313 family)